MDNSSLKLKIDNSKIKIDFDQLILREYVALRDEVLKRLEFQHQILTITLIVAGTFLSIGSQLNTRPILLLLYPILAMFLAGLWEQNNLRIRQIGFFIREYIESKTNGLCWDEFFASGKLKRSNIALFSRGIFVMSQVVAIGMVISRISFSTEEIVLMIFDLISIVITFIIVKKLPIDFKNF